MSELIDNSEKRKDLLKQMILKLHAGESPDEARKELIGLLKEIPYGEVVEVEQQLIGEGTLSEEQVLKFCDIHTLALEGHIDLSGMKIVPPGHPVDTFKKENRELEKVIARLNEKYDHLGELQDGKELKTYLLEVKGLFNRLSDVEKHYLRKENLLFPYLEKYGITGPPKVMWGKHNEIRDRCGDIRRRVAGCHRPGAQAGIGCGSRYDREGRTDPVTHVDRPADRSRVVRGVQTDSGHRLLPL